MCPREESIVETWKLSRRTSAPTLHEESRLQLHQTFEPTHLETMGYGNGPTQWLCSGKGFPKSPQRADRHEMSYDILEVR